MANPQQPEVRRSERNPALSPDAMRAKLEARRYNQPTPITLDDSGQQFDADPRPDRANQPDQPDVDAFAEAFGIEADSNGSGS